MDRIGKPYTFHDVLHANGYSTMPVRPSSKAALLTSWTRLADEPLSLAERQRYANSPQIYGIAAVLGYRGLVVLDRDTDDARVIEALRPVFAAIDASRDGAIVRMRGAKGASRCFRWGDNTPFRNISLASNDLGMMLEFSGRGRSKVIPPSKHPDTDEPYAWLTNRTLLNTRVDELMPFYAVDVEALVAALAPFMPPARPMAVRAVVQASELDEHERARQARYARSIIDRETRTLAAMPANSGRNRATFNLVCRTARFVHRGVLEPRELLEPVMAAAQANGLLKDDGHRNVLATINSGMNRAANDQLPDLRANAMGGR